MPLENSSSGEKSIVQRNRDAISCETEIGERSVDESVTSGSGINGCVGVLVEELGRESKVRYVHCAGSCGDNIAYCKMTVTEQLNFCRQ